MLVPMTLFLAWEDSLSWHLSLFQRVFVFENVWLGDGAVILHVRVKLCMRFPRPCVRSICSHVGIVLLHDHSLLGRHVNRVKLLVITLHTLFLFDRLRWLGEGDNLIGVYGSRAFIGRRIVLEPLHIRH